MDNQNDVWINRQEYERLKALEVQSQPIPTTIIASGPATGTDAAPYPNTLQKSSISMLTILTGVFAIVSFIFPPAILIFLGLGLTSLVKYFRNSKASRGAKIGVGFALGVGLILFLVVAGPFLLLFAFIIMWQIGCWTGLGSCTTA